VTTHYPLEEVRRFISDVLATYDVPSDQAVVVASRMIEADLVGMSGHGVFRLPAYCRRIGSGGYNLRPDIRAVRESPSTALIDGDNGFGQVVMTHAMQVAISKARETGLAWVGVRGSNHAGAGGTYASMASREGLIGIYMAIGSANHLPPWGGTDMLMSTNPLAVSVPAGEEPDVLLDMATTVASYGKIKVAADRGETLPVGWMEDRNGEPLTDPNRTAEGFLLPIAGYKGYGLNLIIGLLAGVLNDAAFGASVVDFSKDFTSPTNTGHAVIALRPDVFRPMEDFLTSMDGSLREMRGAATMPGRGPVRIPGDLNPDRERQVRERGVPMEDALVHRLVELASERGLTQHPFA
jgi:L-2-hydroxycarboxylate dehydrogenase (NAD+)